MDLEQESKLKDCSNVNIKDLQANLFPLLPKMSSFFENYLQKNPLETEENDENNLRPKPIGSKDLFTINRESNFQIQPARWPTECQVNLNVLAGSIQHIMSNPPQPEPYYTPTGLEMQPKPSGEDYGVVVYQYAPISAVNYFSRSSVAGSKYILSTSLSVEEGTLKFESRFESGNLLKAIRLTPNYYELYLRSDLYTNRYMQWFYFRVKNMKRNFLYRFSIVNFTKDGSLYNSGLKPLMYSEKESQLHSIGWRRCGDQITYFSNDNVGEEGEEQHMTYTLTFTVTFPHDNDTVYFASCFPYTYTNLQNYLWEIARHPVKSTYTTMRLLCKSLAGNNVDYITITTPPTENDCKKKSAIVLTARVHPGETPSSWMMKGIIDFLTSDTPPAKELRDKFIFKIVPMLNPDGVVVGNNRCSLSGKDLNRQYRTVMREAYPSIWYTKLMVRRLMEECGVAMYCDLHGHSRKHNIFIYGCENRRQSERRLHEQVFPLMLHKNASEKFSFQDCSFRVQKGKEGTGRIVMWMMGITNSYTLEASFAGSTLGSRTASHFSIQDYEQMGKQFCQTLLDFYDEEPRKEQLRYKILCRLIEGGSSAEDPRNIHLTDYSSDAGSSSDDEGVDSNKTSDSLLVPPPSPSAYNLQNASKESLDLAPRQRNRRSKHRKSATRYTAPVRKAVPIRKTNLKLSLNESKLEYSFESSSESDEGTKSATGDARRLSISKKLGNKKTQTEELPTKKEAIHIRSMSALELLPPQEFGVDGKRRSRTPQMKFMNEKRNGLDVDEQLNMVQQKLMALKNKLWYGSGDADQPLSWGNLTQTAEPPSPSKDSKKQVKKKRNKLQRKDTVKGKPKVEPKRKTSAKNNVNNLKRQQAIDIHPPMKTILVRKSQSFNDVASNQPKKPSIFKSYASCDDKESKLDPKKKKKTKLSSKNLVKNLKR